MITEKSQDPIAAVDIPVSTAPPTVSVGVHGQSITQGHVNTNELDAALIGQQKYITYSNMLANAAIVATGVRYFLNLVGKAKWRAEPADDSAEARRLATKVEKMMHGMRTPWHRVVRGAAMFRYYGSAIQEWTVKLDTDGTVVYADIMRRPQATIERWNVEDDGNVTGVVQRSPQTFKEIHIPRSRVLYMVDDALSDSPEGLGLFRHLVEPVKRLRKYLQLEGWGYENDLRGVPIVKAPLMALARAVTKGDITQAQSDAITAPLEELIDVHARNPEMGLMIDSQTWQTADEAHRPSGMPQFDVTLLDGGNYSLEEVATAVVRINLEIARLLGIEHLMLGADGSGSLALSKDKSDNFALTVDSTLREIRETFQRDFLTPIWELNGWAEELKPRLQTEQITNRDINRIADALTALAKAGIVLSREDETVNEFLELIGLSPLPAMTTVDPDLALAQRIDGGIVQSADSKAAAEAQVASAAANNPDNPTEPPLDEDEEE